MSCIAGIVNLTGAPADTELIEKLTNAMLARGPDEQRYWSCDSLILGHGMLRTTPESIAEHQPLVSRDNKLVLVWDGRLDNRGELRRSLIAGGAALRNESDAELVLHSYAVWGENCPHKLLGDFAFAIWDSRHDRLFCARDHMGARPFYYTSNRQFFAFASEDEALTRLPGVSSRPNEQLVAYSLVPGYQGSDYLHTWFDDVCSLPPATRMTIAKDGTVHSEEYWQLTPGQEHSFESDAACLEAFSDVFGEAVRCRLRSRGDVAAMLSGGLDSAGLAGMAKRLLPEIGGIHFHTYSAISDQPSTCVESRCIQSLAATLPSSAHYVSVPSFSGLITINDLIDFGWSKPHPVDNDILLPAMMCLAASRHGHRVMLHGASGDLTMYVPSRYIANILLNDGWLDAWKECQCASDNFTYLRGTFPIYLLLQNVWTAVAPRQLKLLFRELREEGKNSILGKSLINTAFAEKHGIFERIRTLKRKASPSIADLQQLHIQALSMPNGISNGLQAYDRVAGRVGVELRDPWADKRVVEFFLRLPLKYKVRNGWTKYLVRAGFAQELPTEVRWRSGKEHLGWQFINCLMRETRDLVSRSLGKDLSAAEPYVDVAAFRRRYGEYCASRTINQWEDIYHIIVLVFWMKRISG